MYLRPRPAAWTERATWPTASSPTGPRFRQLVTHCLQNVLTLDESLLRTDNLDRLLRFVSVFDDSRRVDANTTLVASRAPDLINPLPDAAAAYVTGYWERADIVYAISDSATFNRASAQAIIDAAPLNAGAYTYDGTNRGHGVRPTRPGVIAMSTTMNTTGLTAIHEFGHAASEAQAWVWDLYVDAGSGSFDVNKKFRAQAADPVPANFATVDTTTYGADANRDSLNYPRHVALVPSHAARSEPSQPDGRLLAGGSWRGAAVSLRHTDL